MPIPFRCSNCHHKQLVAEHSAGKQVKCQCGRLLAVPHQSNAARADTDSIPSYLQEQPVLPVAAPPRPKLAAPSQRPVQTGGPDQQSVRRWLWRAGGAAVGVVLFGLVVVLFGGARPRGQKQPAAEPMPNPVSQAERTRQALQRQLQVTGTARSELHQEVVGGQEWPYLKWAIDLQLVNKSLLDLDLGKDFFLFEGGAGFANFDGVALFRAMEPRLTDRHHLLPTSPMSLADPYGLGNNFQIHLAAGWFHQRGPRLQTELWDVLEGEKGRTCVPNRAGRPPLGPAREDPRIGFGRLAPAQTRPFKLFLEQGFCTSCTERAGVLIVLPELVVVGRQPSERYRLLVHLQKAQALQQSWEVASTELVPLQAGELARLLEQQEANPIARVCAAAWLAEIDPEGCREPLVRVGLAEPVGPLLKTCLLLLCAQKGTGLEDRALGLVQDEQVSSDLRSWSAVYLGVLRHQPAFRVLRQLAGDSDEAVAVAAIHALGASGPPAAGPLLDLLGKAPARRVGLVADNLVFTGARSPALFAGLWQLVQKDKEPSPTNRAALLALVRSNYPETFPRLQKQAQTERRPAWKGELARALLASGGEQAVPVVVALVVNDQPPAPDELLMPDQLVLDLQGWDSRQATFCLAREARAGNVRALQVLTGIPNTDALFALCEIARTGADVQRFVALDGLARKWARWRPEVFEEQLKHPNKIIVVKAIQGLVNSGNPQAVKVLTPLRDNPEKEIRTAVEQALQQLQPKGVSQ